MKIHRPVKQQAIPTGGGSYAAGGYAVLPGESGWATLGQTPYSDRSSATPAATPSATPAATPSATPAGTPSATPAGTSGGTVKGPSGQTATLGANGAANYSNGTPATAYIESQTMPGAGASFNGPTQIGGIPSSSSSSAPTSGNVGGYTSAQSYKGGQAGQSNNYGGWGAGGSGAITGSDPAAATAAPSTSTSRSTPGPFSTTAPSSYTAPTSAPTAPSSYTAPTSAPTSSSAMPSLMAGSYAAGGPVDPAALGAADSPDPSDPGSGGGYSAGNPDDQQNQNQPGGTSSQHPVDINDSLGAVQDAYATLKDQMLHGGGQQQAGNIPTVPAAPGGDSPSTNPFPVKNAGFGKLADNQNAPRPIQPAPNGVPTQPFNPRDYLPGGSKASDNGAIPDQAVA